MLSHIGHLKAGVAAVRAVKLRSFWTMAGVIIGVASVISVVAIGEGIKQQVANQIHHLGKNIITIRPSELSGSDASHPNQANLISGFSTSGPLTTKDVAVVAGVKGVAASAPLTLVGGAARGDNGSYAKGFVIGTTNELPGLLNQSMAYGAFFGYEDQGSNAAVLGADAADALFDEDVPLGRSFDFRGRRFIVRGIFNEFSTTPLSQQADLNYAIFIPNEVAQDLTDNTAPTYEILARSSDQTQTAALAKAIRKALDKAHGGTSSYSIMTGSENVSSSTGVLDLLTKLIAGVAGISLLVAGIGIMNVMMVSVAERTHEIGMRKALGATNRQILAQFIVESSVLCVVGGAIGIVLALLVDVALRVSTNLQPQISWQVVLLATAVSLFVGIVFGSIPALKAARKDPIQALRSE